MWVCCLKCPVVQKIRGGAHRQQGNFIYSALKRTNVVQEHFNAVRMKIMRCQDDEQEALNICTVPGRDNSDYSHT